MLEFKFLVEDKGKDVKGLDEIVDYEEVKGQIITGLGKLRDNPKIKTRPNIYHLDVGAMYPNIILTNRLQPCSIVNDEICMSCDYNGRENRCKRKMKWVYRVNFFPPPIQEYWRQKRVLQNESFPPKPGEFGRRRFDELEPEEQSDLLKKRFSKLSQKIYKKIYEKEIINRETTVCMRENPFYVDTIQQFRDRRYEYKKKLRFWRGMVKDATAKNNVEEREDAEMKTIIYDSLQIAHKTILNSFYGYVMRKGARWYSMEMAGIVTHTGAEIIKMARQLTERLGKPLELDTDGIWCLLPSVFPEDFEFHTKGGKTVRINFPCLMLNAYTNWMFSNDQYQEKADVEAGVDGEGVISGFMISKRCEIYFEVDGPYRAMILPASKEEGKGIKKRYAVYHMDGRLAELKGFEIKRRGELKIIKIIQGQLFVKCLEGKTLTEAYAATAREANHFLEILYTHGEGVDSKTLLEYLTETSNMSKDIKEYGTDAKSSRLTTAKRLIMMHGHQNIGQGSLACSYIISKEPNGVPVSARAIPVDVFKKNKKDRLKFLRNWTKNPTLQVEDAVIQKILDWDYYIERVAGMLQKVICIPAVLQGEENPIARVPLPDWLKRRRILSKSTMKQVNIMDMFKKKKKHNVVEMDKKDNDVEMEDKKPCTRKLKFARKRLRPYEDSEVENLNEKIRKRVERLDKRFSDPSVQLTDKNFFDHGLDYQYWLRIQKKKWREMVKERKRRKMGMSPIKKISQRKGINAMVSYIRETEDLLKFSSWNIVAIRETSSAGVFRMFFTLGDETANFHTQLIEVNHKVFINRSVPLSEEVSGMDFSWKNENSKILPRNARLRQLYECELKPSKWFIFNPSRELRNDEVLGVYEYNVPPHFRSVVELGSSCKVKQESKGSVGKQMMTMEDFSSLDEAFVSLQGSNRVYVYLNIKPKQGICGLFFLPTNEVKVIVISSDAEIGQFCFGEMQVETDVVSDSSSCLGKMQYHLDEYRVLKKGLTFLILQSPFGVDILETQVPVLESFPIIERCFNESERSLPAVGWISVVKNFMSLNFASFGEYFDRCVAVSEYSLIPIGSIPKSPEIYHYVLDVLFSRFLQFENHLLWYKRSNYIDFLSESPFFRYLGIVKVNNPKFYNCVCVEIEVEFLEINSIINSSRIQYFP